jgi:hypothetical protein
MNDFHRGLYAIVVFWAVVSGAWAWITYDTIDLGFMDVYSISDDDREKVVAITQQQILLISLPIAGIGMVAICGWGYCLFLLRERYLDAR